MLGTSTLNQSGVQELFYALHGPGVQQVVDVRISADFPDIKPRIVGAEDWIQSFRLSPSGNRALFEARGEVIRADVETGKTRNQTGSSGVA